MPASTTSSSASLKEVRAYCRQTWGGKWWDVNKKEKAHRKGMARIAICGGSIAKGATRVQKKSKAKNASNVSNTPTLATCKFVDDETQEYYDTKTNKEIRSPGYEERIVFFHNGGFTMYTGTDDECICEGVNGLRNCVEQGGLPGEVYHGSGFDSGLKWIIGNRFFVGIGGWGEASKSDKKWALETFEEVVVYTGGI